MELDDAEYQLKPMNCPFHILIYKDKQHSYRDLPVRLGELGTVYRYERSGVLNGLFRVRGFTQDDAHIFWHSRADRKRNRRLPAICRRHAHPLTDSPSTRPSFPPGTAARAVSTMAPPTSGLLGENALRHATEPREHEGQGGARRSGLLTGPRSTSSWWTPIDAPGSFPPCNSISLSRARFELEYIGEDGKAHQPLMVHRAL